MMSGKFYRFRPTEEVLPEFLELYLLTPDAQDLINGMKTGINDSGLNLTHDRFLELPVPVPSLGEQSRIVAILEDHLSRLDAATASIAAAGRRAESFTEAALASAVAEVEAPERSLSELLAVKLANGRSVPTREDGFPVLRLTALGGRHVDLAERKGGVWSADEARPFLVTGGDLLVSRGNGSLHLVARGAIVPDGPDAVAFPDTMIRVRPDTAKVRVDYLALVWNSRIVRKQIESSARTTAGIYKVNQRQLEAIRVPVPSLAEQESIAAAISEAEDAQLRLMAATERAGRESAVLRRSLLAAAFHVELAV